MTSRPDRWPVDPTRPARLRSDGCPGDEFDRAVPWSQQELASQAGVGIMTVHQLEKDGSQPRRATLEVVQRALESAGVEFIDENGGGAGVRLRKIR